MSPTCKVLGSTDDPTQSEKVDYCLLLTSALTSRAFLESFYCIFVQNMSYKADILQVDNMHIVMKLVQDSQNI